MTLHLSPHGWLTIHPPVAHVPDALAVTTYLAELWPAVVEAEEAAS